SLAGICGMEKRSQEQRTVYLDVQITVFRKRPVFVFLSDLRFDHLYFWWSYRDYQRQLCAEQSRSQYGFSPRALPYDRGRTSISGNHRYESLLIGTIVRKRNPVEKDQQCYPISVDDRNVYFFSRTDGRRAERGTKKDQHGNQLY